MRRVCWGALTLCFLTFSAVAKPLEDGSINIPGVGKTDCSAWTTLRGHEAEKIAQSWVQGFITGYNTFNDGNVQLPHDGTPPEHYWGIMDSYCKAHPSEVISKAANILIIELLAEELEMKKRGR